MVSANPPPQRKKRVDHKVNGMYCLTACDAALKEPLVIGGWARTEECVKRIDQAGSGYEALKVRYAKLAERMEKGVSGHFESDEEKSPEETKGSDDDEAAAEAKANADTEKKRHKKTKEEIEKEALDGNLYGLLNLQDKGFEASENEINKAYKKAALRHHPDKMGDNYGEKEKKVWLRIQEAYNTLTDPAKRRKYDSSLPFDDKIPKIGDFNDFNFYDVYAKVFNLNAKWSTKKPVPNIGDENTPMKDVHKFYKFWADFKSWREFAQYDEYNTEEAQDRYERRYMEQENKRARKKYEKAERQRLLKLYTMAYENDPRIKKEIADEEAEKQKKKDERLSRKQAAQDEKMRVVREAEEKKAEEERAKAQAKKDEAEARKQRNIAWRKSIKELIALCQANLKGSRYDKYWVEAYQDRQLRQPETVLTFIEKLNEIVAEHGDDTDAKIGMFQVLVDELFLTEDQKKEAALKAEKAKLEESKEKVDPWTKEDIANLIKATVKFPGGTSNRWQTITNFIGGFTQKEVIKKAKELADKKAEEAEKRREEAQKAAAAAAAKPKPAPAPAAEAVDGWTAAQQQQMEAGMKEFTSSMPTKERWIAIAGVVNDKTAKECFTRFKEIVAKLKEDKE